MATPNEQGGWDLADDDVAEVMAASEDYVTGGAAAEAITLGDEVPFEPYDDTDEVPRPGAVLPTDECYGCGYGNAPIGAPCPVCGSTTRVHAMTIEWNTSIPKSFARSLMDVDPHVLADVIPGLADEMIAVLRENLAVKRADRDENRVTFDANDPLSPGEIAPLVINLAAVNDVYTRFAQAFTRVAKAAKDEIGVDMEATKAKTVNIPLGPGGPVVSGSRVTETVTTFNDDRIIPVIAAMVVANAQGDNGKPTQEGEYAAFLEGVRAGAEAGIVMAQDMRTASKWSINAIKAAGKALIAAGHFDLATVMDKAFTQEKVDTGEVKVTIAVPK